MPLEMKKLILVVLLIICICKIQYAQVFEANCNGVKIYCALVWESEDTIAIDVKFVNNSNQTVLVVDSSDVSRFMNPFEDTIIFDFSANCFLGGDVTLSKIKRLKEGQVYSYKFCYKKKSRRIKNFETNMFEVPKYSKKAFSIGFAFEKDFKKNAPKEYRRRIKDNVILFPSGVLTAYGYWFLGSW
jgi:hypothetical protein